MTDVIEYHSAGLLKDHQHRIVAEVDRRFSIAREAEAAANLGAHAGAAARGACEDFRRAERTRTMASKEAPHGQ
jgi:hypothetical protein